MSARSLPSLLAADGVDVSILEGGIEAFAAAGGPLVAREAPGVDVTRDKPSVWVTRERPKIDRIACPWLIRRFIDPFAQSSISSPPNGSRTLPTRLGAIPFDIEDVHYSHRGETCSFDTLIAEFALADPALGASRTNRARRRHRASRSRAAVGRAAGHLAWPFGNRERRSAPTRSRHADLRRALRLVPSCHRRSTTTGRPRRLPHEMPPCPLPPLRFRLATQRGSSPGSGCCRSAARPARSR